jgi:hypothetical protein
MDEVTWEDHERMRKIESYLGKWTEISTNVELQIENDTKKKRTNFIE